MVFGIMVIIVRNKNYSVVKYNVLESFVVRASYWAWVPAQILILLKLLDWEERVGKAEANIAAVTVLCVVAVQVWISDLDVLLKALCTEMFPLQSKLVELIVLILVPLTKVSCFL